MKAEACALLNGLQLCESMGYFQIDIEVDSLVLVKIILKKNNCLWAIVIPHVPFSC